MMKENIAVRYCADVYDLGMFLGELNPENIIAITETTGYTVIYKSYL